MASLCINIDCARHLADTVPFCPYCGAAQQGGRKSARVRPASPRLDEQNVISPAPAATPADAPAVPVPRTAVRDAPPSPPRQPASTTAASEDINRNLARFTESGKTSRRLPAFLVLFLACVVAVVLMQRTVPSLTYGLKVVPCGEQIDSELNVLVDLPSQLNASARLEMQARLEHHIEATHSGIRRANIFATWSSPTDAGRPVLSMCTARSPLAWLLPLGRIDPHSKARLFDAVFTAKQTQGARHATVSQVVSDISSSQFLRAPENKLVVFSNMVEQSPGFSLLACQDADEAIHSYRAARAGGVQRPTFRHTRIELDVVPELGVAPAVAKCRERFWNWYFGDAEGEGTQVFRDYLPGAAQTT